MDYYSYRAQIRDNNPNEIILDALLFGDKLALQYWCDQWIKIEEQRLKFLHFNQKIIKADLYQGLADAVAANDHRNAGTYTVLPATHQGSPRQQHQSYQDAMALVRKYGKPDLFIAMTANPEWDEIKK